MPRLALAALALALGAAGAGAQPDRSGPGETCNAERRPPWLCAAGLECIRPGGRKTGEGVCSRGGAAEGERCNGTVWPPIRCAEGLSCVPREAPPGQPPLLGAGGVCRRG